MLGLLLAPTALNHGRAATVRRHRHRGLAMMTTEPMSSFDPLDSDGSYPTAELMELGGYSVETGLRIFDPLKLAERITSEDYSLIWFRKAELKHGRVAQLACIGYLVAKYGIYFPGQISLDGTTYADLVQPNPFAEWDLVPMYGKVQLFTLAGFFELQAENCWNEGGRLGDVPSMRKLLPWIPGKPPVDAAQEAKRSQYRLAELKHGRLAMIGIAGFFAAENVPNSVPWLGSGSFWI